MSVLNILVAFLIILGGGCISVAQTSESQTTYIRLWDMLSVTGQYQHVKGAISYTGGTKVISVGGQHISLSPPSL